MTEGGVGAKEPDIIDIGTPKKINTTLTPLDQFLLIFEAFFWAAELIFLVVMVALGIYLDAMAAWLAINHRGIDATIIQIAAFGSTLLLVFWFMVSRKIVYDDKLPTSSKKNYAIDIPYIFFGVPIPRVIHFRRPLQFWPFYWMQLFDVEQFTKKKALKLVPSKGGKGNFLVTIEFSGGPDLRFPKAIVMLLVKTLNPEVIINQIEGWLIQLITDVFSEYDKDTWVGLDHNERALEGLVAKMLFPKKETAGLAAEQKDFVKSVATRLAQGSIEICLLGWATRITSITVNVTLQIDDAEVAEMPTKEDFYAKAREIRRKSLSKEAREMSEDSKGEMTFNEAMDKLLAKEGAIIISREEIDLKGGNTSEAARRKIITGGLPKGKTETPEPDLGTGSFEPRKRRDGPKKTTPKGDKKTSGDEQKKNP